MGDVRGVINRFSKRLHATLGWCEVLEDDSEHVCAIRLMHSALVEAHAANVEDTSQMQRLIRKANDAKAAEIVDAALHRREAFERAIGEEGWQAIVQRRVPDWSEQVSLALFTVSCTAELRVPIVQGGALPLLVVLAQNGNKPTVKNCVDALVNMAWDGTTRTKLIEAGAMAALLKLTKMSDDPFVLDGIARVFCYLAFHSPNCVPMIRSGVVAAFSLIVKKLPSIRDAKKGEDGEEDHFWELGQIICLTIRLLAESTDGQHKMLEDGVVELLCMLTASFDRDGDGDVDASDMHDPTDIERALDCAAAFCNIAYCNSNRVSLVQDGGLDAIVMLARSPCVQTQWRCAAALRYLASVGTNRFTMVSQGCTAALIGIARNTSVVDEALIHCAHAVHSLSKSARGRQHMVAQGVVRVLLDLSKSTVHRPTKQNCAAALAYLSHASSTIEEGAIRSLIQMNKDQKSDVDDAQQDSTAISHDDMVPPKLAERNVEAPPTTQLPDIQVRRDHVSKMFVGGGGPPPPPVEPPVHTTKFFTGKVQGGNVASKYLDTGFEKVNRRDEEKRRPRLNSMVSQSGLNSILQTPALSPMHSPRDAKSPSGGTFAAEIRAGIEAATAAGDLEEGSQLGDATPAEEVHEPAAASDGDSASTSAVSFSPAMAVLPATADKKAQVPHAQLPPVRAPKQRSVDVAASDGAALPLWAEPPQPVSSINVWGKSVLGEAGAEMREQRRQNQFDVGGSGTFEHGSFGWQAAQLGLWS